MGFCEILEMVCVTPAAAVGYLKFMVLKCWTRFGAVNFAQNLSFGLLMKAHYGTLATKPYHPVCGIGFVPNLFCETFDTKPLFELLNYGSVRNLSYGTFISLFEIWFNTEPHFLQNQKRILPCIEDKNLFRFCRKPFFFTV